MPGPSERRGRPDGEEPGRRRRPEDSGRGERGPGFFLAVFQSGVREARIYRAYPDRDGVSFLYAGPAVLFLDVEIARGRGHGDWKTKVAQSLKAGLVSAGGAGLIVAALIIGIAGRLIARDQAKDATDLIALVLLLLAVFGVAAVVALTTSVRRITRRLEVLDAMSPEELREEAEREKWCFRVTDDNVGVVSIDAHDGAGGRRGMVAWLSFRHKPTGKWKLILMTRKDAKAAARAFREVLGDDGVEVNLSLRGD